MQSLHVSLRLIKFKLNCRLNRDGARMDLRELSALRAALESAAVKEALSALLQTNIIFKSGTPGKGLAIKATDSATTAIAAECKTLLGQRALWLMRSVAAVRLSGALKSAFE